MIRSFKKVATIVLIMGILPYPLFANQSYRNTIKNSRITAHAEDNWVKNASNTTLGTAVINGPQPAGTNPGGWAGDFVYYGKYDRTKNTYSPIQYRVLDIDTTYFSEGQVDPKHTMLLDCNTVLRNLTQPKCQSWSECYARTWLNGNEFRLNLDYFSAVERNSIMPSTKTKTITMLNRQDGDGKEEALFSPLNGDYIFFLDSKEITNKSYGYGVDGMPRKKTGKSSLWWSRSFTSTKFVYNNTNG